MRPAQYVQGSQDCLIDFCSKFTRLKEGQKLMAKEKCVCGSASHESVTCPQCKGTGRKDGGWGVGWYKCSHCRGTGRVCPKGK